jgi:hypothetical protein
MRSKAHAQTHPHNWKSQTKLIAADSSEAGNTKTVFEGIERLESLPAEPGVIGGSAGFERAHYSLVCSRDVCPL